MLLGRLPAVFILLTFAVTAPAQVARHRSLFSIEGFVRDQTTKQPMESVLVTLKEVTGTLVNTTYTRGNGEFEFDGLPGGNYTVEVSVKDYEQAREEVSISDASRLGLPIWLSRSGQRANSVMGLTISAHQLSVPSKAREEFEKGMMLEGVKSDLRGAIAAFQRAIKDFPTYYEAYAEEGDAYYHLQELPPAEEALRKSIELSSGQYPDAAFTLASLLADTKRFEEAETFARQGMKSDTSSWRGPFELARALNALKKPEEAEKNAIRSRDLMPDNPAVYLLLANIHIQRRDLPGLQKDLEQYLRLNPNGAEADRARNTLDQAQQMMNAQKSEAEEKDEDSEQDSNNKEARPAPKKETPPPVEPDTSGLPSLPPPSASNP